MAIDIFVLLRLVTIIIAIIGIIIGFLVAKRCSGLLRYVVSAIVFSALLIAIRKIIIIYQNSIDFAAKLAAWGDLITITLYTLSAGMMLYLINSIGKESKNRGTFKRVNKRQQNKVDLYYK